MATRVFWSLSVLLASFVALLTLSLPDSDRWQMRYMHVALILVVLTNVGVNVLQVWEGKCQAKTSTCEACEGRGIFYAVKYVDPIASPPSRVFRGGA